MVSWWSAKKPRKQTRRAPRWVERAENRMECFKLYCSVRSRSVRLWRDDLHDHRGGLRRCLDPKVGQEGLNILEDQINGIELTKKLVNIVVVYKTMLKKIQYFLKLKTPGALRSFSSVFQKKLWVIWTFFRRFHWTRQSVPFTALNAIAMVTSSHA